MATPPLRGLFVWHELHTTDDAAAAGIGFYRKVAGWKTQPYAEMPGYTLLVGTRGPLAGVMALSGNDRAMGTPPHWMSYIGTPDVDATTAQARALGGKVHHEPTDITVGRFAILADPQGAVFAIYTPNLLADTDPTPQLGEFCWHELTTPDPEAAFPFYRELFGWEKTRGMDMGDMGVYQMFGVPGLELGGIFRTPPNYTAPPNWVPYIRVGSAAQIAALTKKSNGTVMYGPADVPGGQITMGMDPQGGAFAVHSLTVVAKPAAKKPAAKKPATKKQVAKQPVAKKKAAKKPAARKAAPKKKTTARKKAAPRRPAARKKSGRRR